MMKIFSICIKHKTKLCFVVTISLTLISMSGSAKEVEYCPPYGILPATLMAVDLKNPFLPYVMTVKELDKEGNRAVEIVGDEVRINKEILGSLVKSSASLADPKIRLIKIDARKIIVEQRLSIINGNIELNGESVIFKKGGVISLLPTTTSNIIIRTNEIQFPKNKFRHFDVRQRELPPIPDNNNSHDRPQDEFNDIPKLLQIITNRFILGDELINNKDEASIKLSKLFTLSQLLDFREKIELDLGDAGYKQWVSYSKENAKWPEYSLNVWRSAFKISPFATKKSNKLFNSLTKGEDTSSINFSKEEDLQERLNHYKSIYAEITNSKINYELNAILQAIDSGVDLDGNGPAWASTFPLSHFRRIVDGYRSDEGEGMAAINSMITLMEKLEGDFAPEIKKLTDSYEKEIRQLVVEYDNESIKINKIGDELSKKSKLLEIHNKLYISRESRLKEHHKDRVHDKTDRQAIISGLATAVAIVTTAYTGNPNAGTAAGGIIYTIGKSADGEDTITSLSGGFQFAQQIQEPLNNTADALKELGKARKDYAGFIRSFTTKNITIENEIILPVENPEPGKPDTKIITREKALKDLGGKSQKSWEGINSIFDVYKKFKEAPPQLSSEIEDDASLKMHASNIQLILDEIKNLYIQLEAANRLATDYQNKLIIATERYQQLKTIDPKNEKDLNDLFTFTQNAVQQQLAIFTKAVLDLRKLSFVEFREALSIDTNLIQNVLVKQEISDDWDPVKSESKIESISKYIKLLKERKEFIKILADLVSLESNHQFRNYLTDRGQGPIQSYPEQQFTSSKSSPKDEKRFLNEINKTLHEQFLLRKDPEKLNVLRNRRIAVPFTIENSINTNYPARLIQAAVTDIKHNGKITGGDISFILEIERVGNLRQKQGNQNIHSSSDCFSVDLRSKDSNPDQYYYTYITDIGDIKKGISLKRTNNTSFWYLSSDDSQPDEGRTMLITYPPAEARMYLRLSIDPDAVWISAPRIQTVTVTMEIFQ